MTRVDEASWAYRTGLFPPDDPLVALFRAAAERGRDHRFAGVSMIDPATMRVSPPGELLVTDGRVLPTDGTLGDEPSWFVLPGFVDAHTHVSSSADLAGLLAYGVTGYRQMWGEPAHRYAAGVYRARHLVTPKPWVSTVVVDGPGSSVPEAAMIVRDATGVRRLIAEAVGFHFDGVKVYDDLAPPVFDELVRESDRVGLPVVGHVPARVPLARAGPAMWSTEHLYGVVPNVLRLPQSQRWEVLAGHLVRAEEDAGASAAALRGRFLCPTLTAWRARTGERELTRPSRTVLEMATAGRHQTWSLAAREILKTDPPAADAHSLLVDRVGRLARELVAGGARLLVGTDCGNPFVVAGPSLHKEYAELARAGFAFGVILEAATVEAYAACGWPEQEPAGLVFYRRDPSGRLDVLARPDGVLIDGVFLDEHDLDRLWELRLAAAGLDAETWPRGELNPVHSRPRVEREPADAVR
jgi:hypothetical protein